MNDDGVGAVFGFQPPAPILADHDELVRLLDGLALTVDQGRRGEVVHVMDGANHPHPGPGVTDPGGGSGRDAVLGMKDVHLVRDLAQSPLQGIDGVEHPFFQGGGRFRRRDQHVGRPHGPKEARRGVAERDDADRHSGVDHGLGERQGVHDTAAWLCRVADQRDALRFCGTHSGVATRPGSPSAIAAATSDARAAVSVTMQPARTSFSRCAV